MSADDFPPADEAARTDAAQIHALVLYVVSGRDASRRAIGNVRAICEQLLKDRYSLEVIDLRDQPELAREHDIVATPTLIREHPSPAVRLIGDMSDGELVCATLNGYGKP